jgi:uncharacterized membrane protein
MLGLTPLGFIHTLISLVALVAGFRAFVRDKEIVLANRLGKLYLVTTVLTAATALMIFQRGSFGTGHKLAVVTLVAVTIGTVAATSALFGRASRYVQAISYSLTMLLHIIAGTAETLTRLPPGAPLVTGANAFIFKDIFSAMLVVFLTGLAFQLRWLRFQLIQKQYSADIPR